MTIITSRTNTNPSHTAFVRITFSVIVFANSVHTTLTRAENGTLTIVVVAIAIGTSLATVTQIIIIHALGVHAILATDTIIWVVHADASLTTLTAFTSGIAFTR